MFSNLKHTVLMAFLMITFSTLACTIFASNIREVTPEQETELRNAYEHYREVVITAYETKDTQYLEDIVTGEWLTSITKHAELPGYQTPEFEKDAQIIEFSVIYYGSTIAAVEVREKWAIETKNDPVWLEDVIICELYRESYASDWKVSFFDVKDFVDNPEAYLTAAP